MRLVRTSLVPELYGLAAAILAGGILALAAAAGLTAWAAVLPAAIVAGAVVATGVRSRRGERVIAARIARDGDRLEKRLSGMATRLDRVEGGLQDAAAAAAFSAMDVPFPLQLGGFALDPLVAGLLAREVALGTPEIVLELGSGTSTVVIGMQLARLGRGHVYSLDHDPRYADRTRATVRAMGLEEVVTVLDAPLEPLTVDGTDYRWYRVPEVVAALSRVDLLLVDGPPQATDPGGMPRFPAFPVFASQLVPGSRVFVDDMTREAEQQMVDRWIAGRDDIEVQTVKSRHGLAILSVRDGA